MNKIVLVICVCGLFSIMGCGRVSAPKAPDDSFYPHTYFIQEQSSTEQKSIEPIEDELKDTGLIIEEVY